MNTRTIDPSFCLLWYDNKESCGTKSRIRTFCGILASSCDRERNENLHAESNGGTSSTHQIERATMREKKEEKISNRDNMESNRRTDKDRLEVNVFFEVLLHRASKMKLQ